MFRIFFHEYKVARRRLKETIWPKMVRWTARKVILWFIWILARKSRKFDVFVHFVSEFEVFLNSSPKNGKIDFLDFWYQYILCRRSSVKYANGLFRDFWIHLKFAVRAKKKVKKWLFSIRQQIQTNRTPRDDEKKKKIRVLFPGWRMMDGSSGHNRIREFPKRTISLIKKKILKKFYF